MRDGEDMARVLIQLLFVDERYPKTMNDSPLEHVVMHSLSENKRAGHNGFATEAHLPNPDNVGRAGARVSACPTRSAGRCALFGNKTIRYLAASLTCSLLLLLSYLVSRLNAAQ